MININDFKGFVFFVMNKEGKGSVSPSEFNIATYSALRTWTMDKYGNDAEYQPNMPIPRKGWQITHKITDDLKHLLETRLFAVNDGAMALPDGTSYDLDGNIAPDYLHYSSLNHNYVIKDSPITIMKVPIQILTDAEFSSIDSSVVKKATLRFPKATFRSESLQVTPKEVISVYLTYLRQPKEPKWEYTLDINNRPVYDPLNSLDLDAPLEAFNSIAMMTLNLMGINLRDADVTQYSQGKQQTGI
jgi:hypothetical protein